MLWIPINILKSSKIVYDGIVYGNPLKQLFRIICSLKIIPHMWVIQEFSGKSFVWKMNESWLSDWEDSAFDFFFKSQLC